MTDATPPWPSTWAFGLEPLEPMLDFARATRSLAEAVLSLEAPSAALPDLIERIKALDAELRGQVHVTSAPRVGAGADDPSRRPYLDHAIHVGAYNLVFPEYTMASCDLEHAAGTVRFPVVYEGPPGIVSGGFLAVFFDLVIAHHNSETGISGKTKTLELRYRRPTPLGVTLDFEVTRDISDREITSDATLAGPDGPLCRARAVSVAGQREDLPRVGARAVRPAG
jgi:hypothetical protein